MEDLHHKQGNQQVYGYQANADACQVSPTPARHTATTIIKFIVIHITLVALSPASGTRKTSALNLWRWMAAGCHKWADSKICLCMANKKPAGAGRLFLWVSSGGNLLSFTMPSSVYRHIR
ncbi:TPA: hypothetical protein MBF53_000464 [Klebsiella aerogenes]|nr:hypothetical protein [Klebsiella aerogenes]